MEQRHEPASLANYLRKVGHALVQKGKKTSPFVGLADALPLFIAAARSPVPAISELGMAMKAKWENTSNTSTTGGRRQVPVADVRKVYDALNKLANSKKAVTITLSPEEVMRALEGKAPPVTKTAPVLPPSGGEADPEEPAETDSAPGDDDVVLTEKEREALEGVK